MSPLIEPPNISPHSLATSQQPPSSSSSSLPSISYERPQPRPPRSPARAARTRVRNRRREWLARNPSYYSSLEHELADPLLYDALIRRFQSPEQREREGREKGFGRVLEVDLLRGEARISRLADQAARNGDDGDGMNGDGSGTGEMSSPASAAAESVDAYTTQLYGSRSQQGRMPAQAQAQAACTTGSMSMNAEELEVFEAEDLGSAPHTAEEGRSRWDEFLRRRFVAGRDEDFDYRDVDEDDEYDALERQEQELAWFENEEPSWADESDGDGDDDDDDDDGGGGAEKILTGETGIQDF
ncbi:coiled-coil domain-containing protein-domain-containing protein [Xylariaceae sp. FL0594]|nr:coiled-coil domain-containing protein-domain-containing protein [Xylariaceae sp. FL0594]